MDGQDERQGEGRQGMVFRLQVSCGRRCDLWHTDSGPYDYSESERHPVSARPTGQGRGPLQLVQAALRYG